MERLLLAAVLLTLCLLLLGRGAAARVSAPGQASRRSHTATAGKPEEQEQRQALVASYRQQLDALSQEILDGRRRQAALRKAGHMVQARSLEDAIEHLRQQRQHLRRDMRDHLAT